MKFRELLALIVILALGVSVLCFGVYGYSLYSSGRRILTAMKLTPKEAIEIAQTTGDQLKETDNRINIVLLGVGGGDHDGGDLTDTLLVVSYNTASKSAALLSVPRDIWSTTLQDKVNSAYHYGEINSTNGGLSYAKEILTEITGLPIHYAILIDFSQYETMINAIGGIDIQVNNPFTDTEYPIAGKENAECSDGSYACRYETISFRMGLQHMNGATALQYVRSRHADSVEGTDFSRGIRQQEVVMAVQRKLFSLQPWLNPTLAESLWNIFKTATISDMTTKEQLVIAKLMVTSNFSTMKRISIESKLYVPNATEYGGRYVLLPDPDLNSLHKHIQAQL